MFKLLRSGTCSACCICLPVIGCRGPLDGLADKVQTCAYFQTIVPSDLLFPQMLCGINYLGEKTLRHVIVLFP